MSRMVINLLPDSRLMRYAEKSHKRTAVLTMLSITVGCAAILLISFLVVSAQGLRMAALTKSISEKSEEIKAIDEVNDILATQQRLNSLRPLYTERVKLSAFFEVIQNISPKDILIRNLTLAEGNVITITGTAVDYASASKLAKAMEESGVTINRGDRKEPQHDFEKVVLSGLTADANTGLVSFTISAVVSSEVIYGQ